MTINEIYLEIGQNIYNIIEDDDFVEATLMIERLEKFVAYKGSCNMLNGNKKSLDVRYLEINSNSIHTLHSITTKNGHNHWNKLKFTLLPTFKFDLQFIWDQKFQDEIDEYNKTQ